MKRKKGIRILKWLIWTLMVLVILVFLAQIIVNIYIDDIVEENIKIFEKKTGNRYTIKYDNVHVNLLRGNISVKGFHLLPIKSFVEKSKTEKKKINFIEIQIPILQIKKIEILRVFNERNLRIKRIFVSDARIKIFKQKGKPSPKKEKSLAIKFIKTKLIKFITIDEFEFSKCSLEIISEHKNRKKVLPFHFSLLFLRSKLGLKEKEDSQLYLSPEDLQTTVKNITLILPRRMYKLTIKEMGISGKRSRIYINSLELIPLYKKYKFSRKVGYQISRFQLKTKRIHFKRVNFKDLVEKIQFKSPLVNIGGVELSIFRDRRVIRRKKFRPKQFPQQVFRELKLAIKIDTTHISDGHILYEEHGRGLQHTGKIFFNDIKVHVSNLTNNLSNKKRKRHVKIKASGYIMGKAQVKIRISAPLYSKRDLFYFSGSIQKADMSIINPILKNTFVKIEKGILNKLTFSMVANKYISNGSMRFFYKNLKVALLYKRKKLPKKKFLSFIANQFIRRNNPKGNRPPKIGKMHFVRAKRKSVFYLTWKTLLSGVESSIK